MVLRRTLNDKNQVVTGGFGMRRRDLCLSLVAMPALLRQALAQEVSTIVLGKQFGLPYLPLMVMEELRLVERHAVRLGIPGLRVEYRTLGGTVSLVDALLSGQMHFAVPGVPGLATLWDKTVGTAREVRGLRRCNPCRSTW
jgi:NitT/TauT family transport system substrate-binding protein